MVDSEGLDLQYLEDFLSAKHRQRNLNVDTWMNSALANPAFRSYLPCCWRAGFCV